MNKWWTLMLLLVNSYCQGQERCFVPIHDEIRKAADPHFFQLQQQLKAKLQSAPMALPRNGPLTIPVVFHLVGKSSSYFPTDELVLSQLEVLNEDFGSYNENQSATPFEVRPLAVDMGLRFCLASTDPDGNPSTGIIRTVTDIDCIGDVGRVKAGDGRPRLYYSSLGGSDSWGPDSYLNIWVTTTCDAFLGFATFPGAADALEDGVVIDPIVFGRQTLNPIGTPYDLGRTTTHEVGHYFNLKHLWGNGCESDDEVEDTPNQESSYAGCPIAPSISCGSPDYFFNFMDYTDDACLSMFTAGQRDRVWASISTFRGSLLRDLGCAEPPAVQGNFLIYPNPARDIVYFKFQPTALEPINLIIYDALGRPVEKVLFENVGARWVDVAGWIPGVYYFNSELGYSGSFVVGY